MIRETRSRSPRAAATAGGVTRKDGPSVQRDPMAAIAAAHKLRALVADDGFSVAFAAEDE
jgi:hypothetical protein